MNAPFRQEPVEASDALLMDVARLTQLSPTEHERAIQHFNALCKHVDREGSPLAGKVIECYPSGSFAIGTATSSLVSIKQHDVDVVIELDYPPNTPPRVLLALLFEAINGPPGSRYHGRVVQNTRCVTVTYEDGTTADLMPVARLPLEPARAGNLFHFKRETGEEYHKIVNPWAFSNRFNAKAVVMPEFARAFRVRKLLAEGIVEKAETQPMPDHVPLSEKSPRVVSIQLAKRGRDVSYARRDRSIRRPPSIVIAAFALELGPVQPRLIDELIALVKHMKDRLEAATLLGQRIAVVNEAYPRDVFTDRWPEDIAAQKMYTQDLRVMLATLYRLRNDALSPERIKNELEQMFGESAATYAVEKFLDERRNEASKGSLKFGMGGRVLTGAAATSATAVAAKASTFEGGDTLPE